jgi:hypothetical protein
VYRSPICLFSRHWHQTPLFASAWKTGKSGFGTRGTPGSTIGTVWNTDVIWLRRDFEWDGNLMAANTALTLDIHHDEDVEVYLNGTLIYSQSGYTIDYEKVFGLRELVGNLKPGKNMLAVKCHQTGGGQYIDVGISFTELQ